MRFADDEFDHSFITTIGVDFKLKTIEMEDDNKIAKIQIWDTAGQDRFRAVTRSYYRGAHGIIIVYDITDKESFDNIKQWLFEIDRYASDDASILVIGNKSDLNEKREVEYDVASEYCNELGIEYIETSAKDSLNIDIAFHKMAKIIKDKQLRMNNFNGINSWNANNQSHKISDFHSKPLIGDGNNKRCCVIL